MYREAWIRLTGQHGNELPTQSPTKHDPSVQLSELKTNMWLYLTVRSYLYMMYTQTLLQLFLLRNMYIFVCIFEILGYQTHTNTHIYMYTQICTDTHGHNNINNISTSSMKIFWHGQMDKSTGAFTAKCMKRPKVWINRPSTKWSLPIRSKVTWGLAVKYYISC